MYDLRTKFTKWYYRKGYTIDFENCDFGDGVGRIIYECPWWVRLMTAYFFSPSVYYDEWRKSKFDNSILD